MVWAQDDANMSFSPLKLLEFGNHVVWEVKIDKCLELVEFSVLCVKLS